MCYYTIMTKKQHESPDFWKSLSPIDNYNLAAIIQEYWNGSSYSNFKIKHPQAYVNLIHNTSFLENDATLVNRMWHILNNAKQPLCYCGNLAKWDRHKKDYSLFCSRSCSGKEIIKRSRLTMLEKYGSEHSIHNLESRIKKDNTNKDRYGHINPLCNEEIKEKAKTTNLEKYGVEYALRNIDVQEKRRQTSLKNWGTEYPLQSTEMRDIWREKTGHDFPLSDSIFRNKLNNTLLQKYEGVYPAQRNNYSMIVIKNIMDKNWMFQQHISLKKPLIQISKENEDYDTKSLSEWMFKHGIEIQRYNSSYEQEQIKNFLIENNIKFEENNRTIIAPLELDIFLPEHNLAIEYCGLYWHSELHKDKNYHKIKYDKCNAKNIRLLTIFSDEWTVKKSLAEDKILHILGKSNKEKIYARKTSLKELNNKAADIFYNENHIQGTTSNKSINLALCVDSDTVAIMSFMKMKNNYELTRYATSKNVVGGFSKLLKYFTTNYTFNHLTSFADLRWSNGDVYYKHGFVKDKMIRPDYSYFKKYIRYHKFNFRHKIICKKFTEYNNELTEHQNCLNNSYYRIYDCGKIRFVLKKNS